MSTPTIAERIDTVADGIHRFDTRYIRPRHTAAHVLVSGDDVAIIDCAVTATVEPLLEALGTLGVEPAQVGHLVITHAHMDHAGGAGVLMERLPNARLCAHPSAAKHLVDPTKLEAGVRAVFGDDFFEREYAPVKPVAAERVVATDDGDTIAFGERALQAVHTPGHAWHHQGLWEPDTRTLFSGDAFGVGYPELTGDDGPLFVPETPPPQFVPEEMHASIDRIVDLDPAIVAPTHFEIVTDAAAVADGLHRLVDDTVARCREAASQEALAEELLAAYAAELERRGRGGDVAAMRPLYEFDARLSAQGLWLWREKKAR
ncbi:MAG: MBL fold metallo-hydrolase [Halofilum sp. (in: g-proteobacteria)]|nr:MBL fold metallo-hydrolase [Halofilum sp. (in: g-proteobacteria)]